MIDALMRVFAKSVLSLRYRVRIHGLREIASRGRSSILFLPNHPALVDPVILSAWLHKKFRPRPLADENQIDRFFIRNLARRVNVLPIPDVGKVGSAGKDRIDAALDLCAQSLRDGQNILLYPAGHLKHQRDEVLGAASAAHRLVQQVPDCRVVLVRTRGLWGSSFSWAHGRAPDVSSAFTRRLGAMLASGLVFMPRREVDILLHESDDLPRHGDRETFNRHLEEFYNADAPPATYVPFSLWERGGPREMPEPSPQALPGQVEDVPPATRQAVLDHLREMTGQSGISPHQHLAHDLGLDSLAVADLATWLEQEFGHSASSVEDLQTVGDVMLLACGEAIASGPREVAPPPRRWLAGGLPQDRPGGRADLPEGRTIPQVFLAQARRGSGRVIAADQQRGARTYRDLITAIFALRPHIAALGGRRIGIMLPASVAADTVYLAALFAERTPVMVNWTSGERNVVHSLDQCEARCVLTSRLLVQRLKGQGVRFDAYEDRLVYLEDLAGRIGKLAKLGAALRARFWWRGLDASAQRCGEHAVILFTSGSEALPKGVPLTHENILTNLRDCMRTYRIYDNDRLLSMLPPFHSFGLVGTLLLPILCGVRVVHSPNPNDAAMLVRMVEAYQASLLIGTPTFLAGILRLADNAQLRSLRLCITGAEKCPQRVYDTFARKCPAGKIIEGYGVTECSPIVSANREQSPVAGTIGLPLPSVETAVVDIDTDAPAGPGQCGMLLVRGPSIFNGYLGEAASPFIRWQDKEWYRTGDLVTADPQGLLTFCGRLKRFVKLGGEMISLPAIEAVLEERFGRESDEGPSLAVSPAPDEEHVELVLFSIRDIQRDQANRALREAGLSALHNVRYVVRLDEMPVLGTGKTDYRELARRMKEEDLLRRANRS